jgi:hypothetical protein
MSACLHRIVRVDPNTPEGRQGYRWRCVVCRLLLKLASGVVLDNEP